MSVFDCSKVASSCLLNFNRFEETLEVSSTESTVVVSLDDFKEESGSVLNWLGEDLKKIALIVVIDENVQLLKSFNIFLHLNTSMLKSLLQTLVVSGRNGEELNTSVGQSLDCSNDVLGVKGNMLNTSTTVVLNVLLDL